MSLFCLKPSGISPSHLDENPKSLLWSPRSYKSGPAPSHLPPSLHSSSPTPEWRKGVPIPFLHSGPLPASSSAGAGPGTGLGAGRPRFDPASAASWLSPGVVDLTSLDFNSSICQTGIVPAEQGSSSWKAVWLRLLSQEVPNVK